jgi:hypothetical protein
MANQCCAGPVRAAFDVPANYKLIYRLSVGYVPDHVVNTFNPGGLTWRR